MRHIKRRTGILAALLALAAMATPLGAQDAVVCTACHGANGVSVSDDIPNLAGQKSAYIKTQLQAFRDGKRSNAIMNAVAGQLDDSQIEDLAAHFSGLAPEAQSQASAFGDLLASATIDFPEDYETSLTHYTTVNRPDNGQVRNLYANATALESARNGGSLADGSLVVIEIFKAKLDGEGNPVMGADGFFEKGDRAAFTAMEKQAGWGEKVPETLRNGNWTYAVYSPKFEQKADVNQAKCLACHKPLDSSDYLFSYDALVEKAKGTN